MKKVKVKCGTVKKTAWVAYPYEADFRPIGEKKLKGAPRTRIVVQGNQPLEYEPGKTYVVEVREEK